MVEAILASCLAFILEGQSSAKTSSEISVSDKFLLLASARSCAQRSTSESMPHKSTVGRTSTRPSSVAPYQRISALHGLALFVVSFLSYMNANLKFCSRNPALKFYPLIQPAAP